MIFIADKCFSAIKHRPRPFKASVAFESLCIILSSLCLHMETSRDPHETGETSPSLKSGYFYVTITRTIPPWMCPNNSSGVPSVIQPCCVDKRCRGNTSGFLSNHRRRPSPVALLLLSTNSANATYRDGGLRVSKRHLLRFRRNIKTPSILFQQQTSLSYRISRSVSSSQRYTSLEDASTPRNTS